MLAPAAPSETGERELLKTLWGSVESQEYLFTAGFALGLCCWVRGTKGDQPLCKHLMSSL